MLALAEAASRWVSAFMLIHASKGRVKGETHPFNSIGFSGGQRPSYVEGSSALDCLLIHDVQLQDHLQNNISNIKRLQFYH